MRWTLWAGVLPACLVAFGMIVRRPVRQVFRDVHLDRARDLFRRRREWLEFHFLEALAKADPIERLRWEDAHWHDEVVWARDRSTGRLIALIGVHFDPEPFDDPAEQPPHPATALFEYCKGRWNADGKWLDEIRPDEAFLRHGRFEPVVLPQRRA